MDDEATKYPLFEKEGECEIDKRQESFLPAWEFYRKCFNTYDLYNFDKIIKECGVELCCEKHFTAWSKAIGDHMKRFANRASPVWICFLDLYSLYPWTQFTEEKTYEAAITFTKLQDKPMFPDEDDEQLYDDIYSFCTKHISISKLDGTTFKQWVETGMWANHGTAGDVIEKTQLLAKDKSTYMFLVGPEVKGLGDSLKNVVFPKRDRKNRIIVVGPTEEYVLGAYVNYHLVESIVTAPFTISNTTKAAGWENELFKQVTSGYTCLPIDQTAFDQNQRKIAILAARNFLTELVYNQSGEKVLLELTKNRVETINKADGEIIGYWESGLLSGKWYTSIVGSVLNAYECYRANNRSWDGLMLPTLHQGDDTQATFYRERDALQFMQNVKPLNIPVNPHKNFMAVNRTDYLHCAYSTQKEACLLGDARHRRYTIWGQKYPARAVTSIIHGDQEARKESTSEWQQSGFVSKQTDRMYAILTRLNNFSKDAIDEVSKQTKLNDLEREYQGTPTSLGGLGALDLGVSKIAVEARVANTNFYGVIDGVGGYVEALRITEMQTGLNLKQRALETIESGLKFRDLPDEISAKLKSRYYNLQKTNKKVKLTTFNAQITRETDGRERLEEPVARNDLYWKALAAGPGAEISGLWSQQSREMYLSLHSAGKYVQKLWVDGKLKIKVNYSKILSGKFLSDYSSFATQMLLDYCANNRGTDISPIKLRSLMYELEMKFRAKIENQDDLYFNV